MKHDKNMRYTVQVLRKAGYTLEKIMEITQRSKNFVCRWIKEDGIERKNPPRIRKINGEIKEFMNDIAKTKWTDQGGSLRSIAKCVYIEKGIKLSHITVRYHLKKHFKYLKTQPTKVFLSDTHKLKRIAFCNRLINQGFTIGNPLNHQIMFTDEKIFRLNHIPNRQTHKFRTNLKKIDAYEKKCFDVSIHVAGALTYNGLSDLHMFQLKKQKRGRKKKGEEANKKKPKGITAEYYRDEIIPVYKKKYLGNCSYFQQDGARPHTASIEHVKREFGNVFDWPANSPDLNPIENLWSILQQKVDAKKPQTKNELIQVVFEEWNNIEISTSRKLVESFPKRLQSCVDSEGKSTKY
jgi:hypothetical protein